MERPNVLVMDEIEAILQSIGELEETIKELKSRLKELPKEMAKQIPVTEERIEAARYLYWVVPELAAAAISKGLLGLRVHQLKQLIGATSSAIHCDRCGEAVRVRNRTHLQELRRAREKERPRYAEGYKVLCDGCWAEIRKERDAEWKEIHTRRKARLHELKTMPYAEYLLTPEWQKTRKQHLRSTGFRCQTCNKKDTPLHVHHRTYERRGEERFKDLIALCHGCHELFHSNRSLSSD